MILTNKTAWDIGSKIKRSPQKVDSKQYLINLSEPRHSSYVAHMVMTGTHSGTIKDTFYAKELFRRTARKLRARV